MNGQDFREWRKTYDLTQEGAGQVVGVTKRTVAGWEMAENAAIPAPITVICTGINGLALAAHTLEQEIFFFTQGAGKYVDPVPNVQTLWQRLKKIDWICRVPIERAGGMMPPARTYQ